MIKIVAPAIRHASNRSAEAFRDYWATSHGPLYARTATLRRYVQHLTLPEAYGRFPQPTYDGVSMFWYDSVEASRVDESSPPEWQALRRAVLDDSRIDARPDAARAS